MLTITKDGPILTVKETQMSFRGTRVHWYYYDTEKWLVSAFGRKGDTPMLVMSQASIAYVKQHYLPRAEEAIACPSN